VDYGVGNLRSVAKAFERMGAIPVIVNNISDVIGCDCVIFPGVGAFDAETGGIEVSRRNTG